MRETAYSLPRAVGLAMVVLVCLSTAPTVHGQAGITSVLNLHFTSHAALQNGVAQVPMTFTLYYGNYENPGGYLAFGVYVSGTSNLVNGSATSTPDPCQSLAGTPYQNAAVCAIVAGTASGSESASATLMLNQAQQYSLSLVTFVWDSMNLQSGNRVPGSTSESDFTVTVTGQATSTTSTSTSPMTGTTPMVTIGQGASLVLGQPDFTTSTHETTQTGLWTPLGVVFDSHGNLWVADANNNRVLEFTCTATSNCVNVNGAALVLGQSGFTTGNTATSQTGLWGPAGVVFDSHGNLWVADFDNDRVLEYTCTATSSCTNGNAAALVLGQSSFTTRNYVTSQTGLADPQGVGFDSQGNLWVADALNNRTLEYTCTATSSCVNGNSAALVLGQPDFTTNKGTTTQTGLSRPTSLVFDSHGNLWIADRGNNRVLEYASAGTTTSTQTSQLPSLAVTATVTMGSGPWGVAYDSGKGEVFVTNMGGGTVSVISDASNAVIATVTVGNGPIAVAYDSGKGEVFVTNRYSDSVSVISDASNTAVATVTGLGAPVGVAYDHATGEVFVANNGGNSVSVISDASNSIVATITGLSGPTGAAFDSRKGNLFVQNSGSGTVSVISDDTNAIVATVTGLTAGIGVGMTYDPGKGEVFVTQGNSNSVSVISDTSNTVTATVTGLNNPSDLTYDSRDGEIFVTNNGGNSASAISDASNTVIATVQVGNGPRALAYDSALGEVFVANNGSGTVSVITLPTQASLSSTTSAAQTSVMSSSTLSSILGLSGIMDLRSQATLLLIGVIIILVVLLAAVILRRRKPSAPAPGTRTIAEVMYCRECGRKIPRDSKFCKECGAKL